MNASNGLIETIQAYLGNPASDERPSKDAPELTLEAWLELPTVRRKRRRA